jgi:YaaC-like Protein
VCRDHGSLGLGYNKHMPQLPAARDGETLSIKGRDVAFSFFPVRFRDRGWTLSDTVFAVSPWAVMQGEIDSRLDGEAHEESTAFLNQSRDFYVTASERLSANPLLFYYAFLNLGKALLRVRGLDASLDHAHHGLGVRNLSEAGSTPEVAAVRVREDEDKVYVFPELFGLIEDQRFRNGHELPVDDLLSQVVVGHRQWRDASDREERFIVVTDAELMHDRSTKSLWVRLFIDPQDLSRYEFSVQRVVRDGRLAGLFRHVQSPTPDRECLELIETAEYPTDPADGLAPLVARARPALWRIASALPGGAYRRYYLHLTPEGVERATQLSALWALWFYFGSVVRYRPHSFDRMIAGRYGAYLTEFVAAQPEQLLYLLASELCQREVAKPAIA